MLQDWIRMRTTENSRKQCQKLFQGCHYLFHTNSNPTYDTKRGDSCAILELSSHLRMYHLTLSKRTTWNGLL